VSNVGYDRDPDWGPTRRAIAHLLWKGLRTRSIPVTSEFQDDLLYIGKALLADPTSEHENHDHVFGHDLMNMSINTVRGTAMHVIMSILEWNVRFNELNRQSDMKLQTLNIISELKCLIEDHLRIDKDVSLSIRAVYGEWFPMLYFIDREWAITLVSRVFP